MAAWRSDRLRLQSSFSAPRKTAMTAYSILLLPGDGIGPEVIDETQRVLGWFAKNRNFAFHTETAAVGGNAYESFGTPGPDETIAKAKQADAVLFGAVGGP